MSDPTQILEESKSSREGTPTQPRFEKRLLILGLFLMVLICAGGWLYYQYQSLQARKAARESLAAIADLKADEVSNWLSERRGDAEVARTSVIAKGVVTNPNSPEARQAALTRAEIFRRVYGYAAVVFADAQGRVQMKVPADYPLADASLNKHIQEALHSQRVQISDLNRDTTNGPILMWLECPIFSDFQTNSAHVGAVILVIDPRTFLYAVIKKWPTPSTTAETVIIRRDGDDVVMLSDLRFGTNTAINMRLSIAAYPDRPAVRAIQGQGAQGVDEAVDYRGKPVFWTARKIEGMPWLMLTMIDQEEVLAPLRREAWEVGTITALLLVASMLGISLLWRQQKLADVRTNEERLQMLIEQAPTAIRISRDGKTIYVNRKYLDWYGYSSMDELIGNSVGANWAPESRATVAEYIRRSDRGEPTPDDYEGMAQRKDGSQFPVHVAVASVELPDGRATLVFINDITERKAATEKIEWLATFPEKNPNPVVEWDMLTSAIHYVNPTAMRLFPDIITQGLEHPFVREISLKFGQRFEKKSPEVLRHDVRINDRYYTQAANYVPGSQRVRVYSADITERQRAEEALERQMTEVRLRNEELERFNIASTDRELRIIELKKEINELCRQSGNPLKYRVNFSESESKDRPT